MLITKQKDLESFCKSIKNEKFITIDTEFLREKTYYPKLCLIQISDKDKNAVAIDPLAKDIDLAPVLKILEDKKILKVFHAARQDLEIFYNMTGKVPAPVFDTQIAAMVCGFGDSVGYSNLVQQITGDTLDKNSQFTNWSIRPLSKKQLDYAISDVTHLVDVYLELSKTLEKQNRTDWVEEENEIQNDPETYRIDTDQVWQRIKLRSPKPKILVVLQALAKWREEKAQTKDIPKTWLMRDETLADLAAQAPKDAEELKRIRGFPKDKVDQKLGRDILKIIKKALQTNQKTWPKVEKTKRHPKHTQSCVDALKMLLRIQAQENDVAPRLIASSDDLQEIALDDKADVPALKGWRKKVFGQTALDFKHGKVAIGMDGNNIVQYKITDKTTIKK